jgi:hypothetical protein
LHRDPKQRPSAEEALDQLQLQQHHSAETHPQVVESAHVRRAGNTFTSSLFHRKGGTPVGKDQNKQQQQKKEGASYNKAVEDEKVLSIQ